jgi:hypothetical protein
VLSEPPRFRADNTVPRWIEIRRPLQSLDRDAVFFDGRRLAFEKHLAGISQNLLQIRSAKHALRSEDSA